MLKELEMLSATETETILKSPMLVCILIAGADNQIDNSEIRQAIELAKKGKAKLSLDAYYKIVSEDFEDKLKIILQSFPNEAEKRNPMIVKELTQLNAILPKINKTFTSDFYRSLMYIAKKIAESSGGVLGIHKVGDEEMELVKLPMIKNPVPS
jgi:hypothetical protein